VEDALPWLCQGDVFELLPQVVVSVGVGGTVATKTEVGACLLVTHGCDLDKPQGRADDAPPRVERLQFLPLRDLDRQDQNRQNLLRRHELSPAEAIHVGPVSGVGDAFGVLSEMFYLPAGFFGLSLIGFPGHPEAEQGKRHLVASRHGNRAGRLGPDEALLLRQKMAAYWPRFDTTPQGDTDGEAEPQ